MLLKCVLKNLSITRSAGLQIVDRRTLGHGFQGGSRAVAAVGREAAGRLLAKPF